MYSHFDNPVVVLVQNLCFAGARHPFEICYGAALTNVWAGALLCYCFNGNRGFQVVYSHLDDPEKQEIKRGVSYLKLRPGMYFPV